MINWIVDLFKSKPKFKVGDRLYIVSPLSSWEPESWEIERMDKCTVMRVGKYRYLVENGLYESVYDISFLNKYGRKLN